MFRMRERNDWQDPDSISDAWLLFHGKQRSWFPYYDFMELFPEYKEIRPKTKILTFIESEDEENELDEENDSEKESDSDDENEAGATKVYIDDPNKDAPQCSFTSCSPDHSTPDGIIPKQEVMFKPIWVNACQPIEISHSDDSDEEHETSKERLCHRSMRHLKNDSR